MKRKRKIYQKIFVFTNCVHFRGILLVRGVQLNLIFFLSNFEFVLSDLCAEFAWISDASQYDVFERANLHFIHYKSNIQIEW